MTILLLGCKCHAKPCCMHGCCPGLNRTDYAPGNLLRFELVFRLNCSYDENYFHVHTLKASAVPMLLELFLPCACTGMLGLSLGASCLCRGLRKHLW